MPNPMTQSGRWSALTRPQPSCWPRPGPLSLPSRGVRCGRTTSTGGRAPATGSWPVSLWRVGATWRLLNGARCRTSLSRCAGWWMKPTQRFPVVRVVLDHLNTHRWRPCTRPSRQPRRGGLPNGWNSTTRRSTSWLNMAEIEFSVLARSCLKQRLPDAESLQREVGASVRERNEARVTINWRFKTQDARTKLHRLYPFDS